jgi:hypothetical protein
VVALKKGSISKIFILTTIFGFITLTLLSIASGAGIWDYVKAGITGRATSSTFNLNISVGNTAPNITSVRITSTSFSPTEASTTAVTFEFTVNDTDGYQNINTASAKANATYTNGSTVWVAANNSCASQGQQGSHSQLMNFTCTLRLWYFYPGGDSANQNSVWNLTLYAEDTSGASGQNRTANFSYSQLKAFTIEPGALTFSSISPGSTNTSSNNDPLILNNTGNYHFSPETRNISINATNLVGETNSAYALYANNFTVGTYSTESINCGNSTWSHFLNRGVFVNITRSNMTLGYGNYTQGNGIAQMRLHTCLARAGNELTSQAYSTNGPNSEGSWQIAILPST